ncbi:unnamed protein product [Rhizoctonia solani]|uniref:G domain-containing protein n=1 Tax=Rhizoctonia solani TaxID=456999 RepID=A0A8H3ARW7_9AGAM|nr:unnamed protein product [Rhizoctonia solani]
MAVIKPEDQKNSKNTRGNARVTANPSTSNNRPIPNPKQANGKTSGTKVTQAANSPLVDSVKSKDELIHVPILILGPQGSGKSSLVNAAFSENIRETSNGFELATQDFHFISLATGKHKFMLVDSPGLDNTSYSDGEVMTKLVRFLCCGKNLAKVSGVIYIHPQGANLGSGVLKRNLYLLRSLLGDTFLNRLTVLLVHRSKEKVNQQQMTAPLLDSKSPFRGLCDLGARVEVSSLETQPVRDLLLSFAEMRPDFMGVQNELCRSGRMPNDGDISTYLTKCARIKHDASTFTRPKVMATSLSQIQSHVSSSARQPSKYIKRLELQLAESKKQTEDFSSQLQQHLSQYTALCSQLQIHENTEQSEIVQNLVDINRRIEDLALSLSQYLVDTYGGQDKTTTQFAVRLSELKLLFEHDDRKGSLVQSSKGAGMLLEDFLDVAIRSILCEQLYKRIFAPFHPGISLSDPRNGYTNKLYSHIKEKETQATLGRWRTASFAAISGAIGESELLRLKTQVGPDILNINLMPMLGHLFGPKKNVRIPQAHTENLTELVTQAWDWCVMLKEKIVLLGDYQPTAYRYGAAFDTNIMSEFEAQPGSQPDRILSTIGLGLNVGFAKGTGEGEQALSDIDLLIRPRPLENLVENLPHANLRHCPLWPHGTSRFKRKSYAFWFWVGLALEKHIHDTKTPLAGGLYEATKKPYSKFVFMDGRRFELIDTPGFDNVDMSDAEVFTEIAAYLLGNHLVKLGVTGVIYVHRTGDVTQSRSLARNLQVLADVFLREIGRSRFTILESPRSAFKRILAPGFNLARQSGRDGFIEILKTYFSQTPIILPIHLSNSHDWRSDFTARVEQVLGYYEHGSVQTLLSAREHRLREMYEANLARQRELELQLQRQLKESESEYSSLRSQLQLQENVEQSEVVQTLNDLNRMIDDIGRSVSAYLTDTYVPSMLGDPSDVTSLDAVRLSSLKNLLGYVDGKPSMIMSPDGQGMQIESFFDFTIRHIICRYLAKEIFRPFHPAIHPYLSQTLIKACDNIYEQAPQAVAGKWRSDTFKNIYTDQDKCEKINNHIDTLMNDQLKPLTRYVLGRNISFAKDHHDRLHRLMEMAWDWNSKLKGDVIMLGEFVQTAFATRVRFNRELMEEFEASSRNPQPRIVLGTLALGLSSQRAVGGGDPVEETVVCKALVLTDNAFA